MSGGAQNHSPRFGLRDLLGAVTICGVVLGLLLAEMPLAASLCLLAYGVISCRKGSGWSIGLRVCAIVMAVACGFGTLAIRSFLDLGPIYFRDDWPYGLVEMDRLAGSKDRDVYARCLEGFLDREYVYRLPVDREGLRLIEDDFELAQVALDADSTRAFWSRFPWLWKPRKSESVRFFKTPDFSVRQRGDDGDHYLVAYDPQSERLFVWLKSNF